MIGECLEIVYSWTHSRNSLPFPHVHHSFILLSIHRKHFYFPFPANQMNDGLMLLLLPLIMMMIIALLAKREEYLPRQQTISGMNRWSTFVPQIRYLLITNLPLTACLYLIIHPWVSKKIFQEEIPLLKIQVVTIARNARAKNENKKHDDNCGRKERLIWSTEISDSKVNVIMAH